MLVPRFYDVMQAVSDSTVVSTMSQVFFTCFADISGDVDAKFSCAPDRERYR